MKKLDDYTNEPNFSGDAQHEADSLLNRGGAIGAFRDVIKSMFKYWFVQVLIILVLTGLGLSWKNSKAISEKLANYDIAGGVKGIEKATFRSTILNKHWIYKTELASDYQDSEGKRLSDVAKYIEDEGDYLISKKTFDADIYNVDLFGALFSDATETCEDDFLSESYPIVFNSNYYPDDEQEWEGKQKFKCVYKIRAKENYIFKGKE